VVDGGGGGGGRVGESDRGRTRHAGDLARLPGEPGVVESLSLGIRRRLPLAGGGVDGRNHPPRFGELRMILTLLQTRDQYRRLVFDVVTPRLEVIRLPQTHEHSRKQNVRSQPVIAQSLSTGEPFFEEDLRPGELARFHDRLAQVRKELEARWIALGQELARTAEQIRGGGHVAASKRTTTCGRQSSERPSAELETVVVQRAELGEIVIRLFEVIAENLLELGPTVALAVHALGPVDEALVERRSRALENALVGGIANEDVVEAVLVRPLGLERSHQLLLGHRAEMLRHRGLDGFGRKLLDRRLLEDLPDHRGRLDHRPLLGREQVQTRRQQSLNRSRDRELREIARRNPGIALAPEQAIVDQHREELFDKEWVAFRRGDDPGPCIVGNRRVAEEVLHDEPTLLFGERLQLDERAALSPVRTVLEQVRSSRAEQQERHARGVPRDVFDQVEEPGFGPVDVLEEDDQRLLAGLALEELAGAPE